MNATVEASIIPSNCRRLSSPISICLDLTLSKHNLYLTQQQKLIDVGVDSGILTLRKSGLFASGKLLVGQVIELLIVPSTLIQALVLCHLSCISGTTLPLNSLCLMHAWFPLLSNFPPCESVSDSPSNSLFSPLSASW